MSIQQIQTKNLLEFISKAFFVKGINPASNQLYAHLSNFFSVHPAGLPITLDKNIFISDEVADEDVINDFMAVLIVNIDTLYEVCAQHIDQILMLNTVLRTHLDRLKIKRKLLEAKIDDYLLGIYNSDGYFYSFSDSFADTSNTDLAFTSAFVDTLSTTVTIPSVSSVSSRVQPEYISEPNIGVEDSEGKSLSWQVKTDFANAVDGMTNTAWYFEVRTPTPTTLTATLSFQLSSIIDARITKVDVTPFGVTEVQCGINANYLNDTNTSSTEKFCNYIKTSADKMSFVGDQVGNRMSRLIIQLTKTTPDYVDTTLSDKQYVYMFGFKELLLTEQSYDPFATLVTRPIGIPAELENEATIDAVSLVTEDYSPTNTDIVYYVASDNSDAKSLEDFNWRKITPLRSENRHTNVVVFDGSTRYDRMIRKAKRNNLDIQMIPLNNTSPDLAKRNPTPSYLPGVDTYRIAEFNDDYLAGTLTLEEGINTTRIFYTELNEDAINKDFSYWKAVFDNPNSHSLSYGEIDSGYEFFYGADVGENKKSVYVETYLETDKEYPVFLKECRKSDVNSQLWNVRLFLNGREIANMPVGINKLTVPWKLKEGINHIVLMANIPDATVATPSPYIGTFNIMTDANLYDFGSVKLNNWTYVDYDKMLYNQVNQHSFTIYNNEIISRKQPTNNFKLSYKKSTSSSPRHIRLRADLTRTSQNASSTPIIDSYRLRFAYR